MSAFVMSLRRLYKAKAITDAKVESLLDTGKISDAEAHFIRTGEIL